MNKIKIGGHYDEVFSETEFMKMAETNLKSGGNVMQIFIGDRTLTTLTKKFKPTSAEANEIKTWLKKNKTLLFIHGNLRVNLSAPLEPRYLWNQENVIYDMNAGKKIGATGVIIHLGTRTLQGKQQSEKEAYKNMKKSVQYILDNSPASIKLILEVNAGETNKIGKTIFELAKFYDTLPKEIQRRIGFCLDTAHLFSASYHMNTVIGVDSYFKEFDEKIGLKKVMLTHLNDSDAVFGSKIDRHQSLGQGYIYTDNLEPLGRVAYLLKKNKIPIILETRDPNLYQKEIKIVNDLANKIMRGGSKKQPVLENLQKMEMLHLILGNKYQAKAYKNAIAMIKAYLLKEDRNSLTEADLPKLAEIEGIGKETIIKIKEIMKTGKLNRMHELLKEVPYTENQLDIMLELQKVIGIGPKVSQKMVQEKGIKSVADLEKRSNGSNKNKIRLTQMQKLGLKYFDDLQKPIPRSEMEKWQKILLEILKKEDKSTKATLAGSYRLGKKQSGDIDLIVMVNKINSVKNLETQGAEIMKKFIGALKKKNILLDYLPLGETEIMAFVKMNGSTPIRHLDLKLIPEESLPFYLLYFGSGEKFSRKIRALAKKQGYKLSQWGIQPPVKVRDEQNIFKILGIPYVKPEDRLF